MTDMPWRGRVEVEAQSINTQVAGPINIFPAGEAAHFNPHPGRVTGLPAQATSRMATVRIHDLGTGRKVVSQA